MRRLATSAVLAAVLTGSAAAEVLGSRSSCGGDAYSSAQVIEGKPPRRGPLTSVPDTLCADVDPRAGSTRIEIYGVPGLGDPTRDDGMVGARDGRAPYGGDGAPARRLAPRHRSD